MQSRDFVYWLQGFFELTKAETLSKDQVVLVRSHLNLVFKHEIDPAMGDAQHQQKLNETHHGFGPNGVTMRC